MWKKIISILLMSLLIIPGLVHAEDKEVQEIKQIPVSNQNYNYTSQAEDFRDTLSKQLSIFSTGIYSGPHLPPVNFALSYGGDVQITVNLKLPFDVFTYGASDYYIYIPILNPPSDIDMYIKIDGFTFLDDDYFAVNGWYKDGMNFTILNAHGLIYYTPEGYIIHNPFLPLTSSDTHTLEISIHDYTSSPIKLRLSQSNLTIIDSDTLKIGTFINRNHNDFHVDRTINDIPLAVAFLATQGLTSFGLGAVELPGSLGIYVFTHTSTGGQYATIDMPVHFSKPDYLTVNYTWDDINGTYNKHINAYVKNFVIHSTDTKLKVPASGEYSHASFVVYPEFINTNYTVFITTQKQSSNLTNMIYDRLYTPNPSPSDFDKEVSKHNWAFSAYATHIVVKLKFTDDRYVALNSTNWEISREEFAKMALENGLYLQYYDLATNGKGPLASIIVPLISMKEGKLLIKNGATQVNSNRVGFKTYLNLFWDKLKQFGQIVWQVLLKFYHWVIHEVLLFWSWIAPVLQLALFFIFVLTTMFIMKYLSKILIKRGEKENAS